MPRSQPILRRLVIRAQGAGQAGRGGWFGCRSRRLCSRRRANSSGWTQPPNHRWSRRSPVGGTYGSVGESGSRSRSRGWFVVGSGLIHLAYFTSLQFGYRLGDLSVVYPLARGTGPVIATVAAIAFLDERPSALALVGVVLVAGGVLLLAHSPTS